MHCKIVHTLKLMYLDAHSPTVSRVGLYLLLFLLGFVIFALRLKCDMVCFMHMFCIAQCQFLSPVRNKALQLRL